MSYAVVRIASAGTLAALSLVWTASIASALRRCASRGLGARDSAVMLIHARSGTARVIPSPETTTTGSTRGGCCAAAATGAVTSRATTRTRSVTGHPLQAGTTYSDAARPVEVGGLRIWSV